MSEVKNDGTKQWTDRLPTVDQVRRLAAVGEIPAVWIAVALVAFFPLGLYLVWKHPGWPTKTKGIWTGAWAVSFVLGMWLIAPLLIFLTLLGTFGVAFCVIWSSSSLAPDKKKLATGLAVGGLLACLFAEFAFFSIRAYNADHERLRDKYAEDVAQNEGKSSPPGDGKVETVADIRSEKELVIGRWVPFEGASFVDWEEYTRSGQVTSDLSTSARMPTVRRGTYKFTGKNSILCTFPDEPADEFRDYTITVTFSEGGNVMTVDGKTRYRRQQSEISQAAQNPPAAKTNSASFLLPDGSKVATSNATKKEKAMGLLKSKMTPSQVEGILSKPDRVSTNRSGDKMWHYKYIGRDATAIIVGFPGKGESMGVLGILIADGKEMIAGKSDYRKDGGGVDVGDVSGW